MAKRGDPWFKFYPDDWMRGTRTLSLEQRGAYIDAICMQMLYEAPLQDDYAWLAHQMHVSSRKAKSIVDGLIEAQKLRRIDAGISNDRCVLEIESKLNQRRTNAETAANRERAKRENSENRSKNNVNGKNSCNETGTTRARSDTDTDTDKKRSPPTPQGGGQAQDDFQLEPTDSPKAIKAAERKRLVEAAVGLYNKAADHWGLSICRSVTSARAGRIEKRLADIGGLDNFRLALRAIGKDDFLMGRKPARPGDQPFRLTIDRLLSTETNMGDVLARLLDQATEPEQDNLVGPNGKRWGWWRGKEEQLRDLPIEWWRKAVEAARPNGTWPWWILTAPPGHKECLMPQEIQDENKFVEIYRGQITHA